MNDAFLLNRMKLCVVAIGLMWLTTLRIAVFISSIIITVPDFKIVYSTCSVARSILKEEEDSYYTCAKFQSETCRTAFLEKVKSENQRVNISQAYNQNILKQTEAIDTECFDSFVNIRHALQTYTDIGNALPFRNYSNIKYPKRKGLTYCSETDRQMLNSMVGDLNSFRSAAFDMSEQFSVDTLSTFEEFAAISKQRVEYDRNYVGNYTHKTQLRIRNQINSVASLANLQNFDFPLTSLKFATDGLLQCVSPRGVSNHGNCPNFDGVQEQLSSILQLADSRLQQYEEMFDKNVNKMKQYKNNAYNSYLNFKRFYDGMTGILKHFPLIRARLNVAPLSHFFPYNVNFPSKPDFPPLPTMESIWTYVSPALSVYEDQIDAIIRKLNETEFDQMNYIRSISSKMSNFVADIYKSPLYYISEELDKFRDRNMDFLERSSLALQAFSEFETIESKMDNVTHSLQKFINTSHYKFKALLNADINFFEPLNTPKIDVDFWLNSFSYIQEYLFLADNIYRVYNCGRLIHKYWSAGSVKLPEIDIRAYKGVQNPLRLDPRRAILLLVASPLTGVTFLIILMISCLSLLTAMYIPLYTDYVSGCVKLPPPSTTNINTGTFLSTNLFSIAYNYGSHKGDQIKTKKMTHLNNKRQEVCTNQHSRSVTNHNKDIDYLTSLLNIYDKTSKDMNLMNSCLNIQELDAWFDRVCCGNVGFKGCYHQSGEMDGGICPMNTLVSPPIPFMLPEHYIKDKSCTIPFHTRITNNINININNNNNNNNNNNILQDAVFNCKTLPKCRITCKGPHKPKIKSLTSKCSCSIEWFIHSFLTQTGLSFFLFLGLNFSRYLFLTGLTRCLWKSVHPPFLVVKSTCKGDSGEMMSPVGNKDISEYLDSCNDRDCNTTIDDSTTSSTTHTFNNDSCSSEEEKDEENNVKKVINRQIQKIFFRFTAVGYVMIVCSILVIVACMLLLFRISHSITPDWIN